VAGWVRGGARVIRHSSFFSSSKDEKKSTPPSRHHFLNLFGFFFQTPNKWLAVLWDKWNFFRPKCLHAVISTWCHQSHMIVLLPVI